MTPIAPNAHSAETLRDESSARTAVAGAALVLSAIGAASLALGATVGFLTPATESLFTLLALVGWTLIVWAALLGGATAATLIRLALHRRRAALVPSMLVPSMLVPSMLVPSALVIATAGVIAAVVIVQPLFGGGGGAG